MQNNLTAEREANVIVKCQTECLPNSRPRKQFLPMRSIAEWLERQTANTIVATVLGSIPASSDTVESEGRQMKQC